MIRIADIAPVGPEIWKDAPENKLMKIPPMIAVTKPAAAVAVCRRGGASACFDRLNKYFTINNMPVASSQYWNSVHGWEKGEATQDAEGLQTMRTLARNMAWMMRNLAKEQRPESEKPKLRTNFI